MWLKEGGRRNRTERTGVWTTAASTDKSIRFDAMKTNENSKNKMKTKDTRTHTKTVYPYPTTRNRKKSTGEANKNQNYFVHTDLNDRVLRHKSRILLAYYFMYYFFALSFCFRLLFCFYSWAIVFVNVSF